jgi:multidrug efflux pump subunit AcrA (membrane-fusion protein)
MRHLELPEGTNVTCGAFAPQHGDENAETVFFTGGSDRIIRVWKLPPANERSKHLEAIITTVSSQIESGTGLVRVRAELDNPTEEQARLYAGASVNLTIYPETAFKK